MHTRVVRWCGRFPVAQQGRIDIVNLNAQRPTNFHWIGGIRPPDRHRHVAVRAGRDRAQKIDLGEKFEVVPLLAGAGLDEILVVLLGQPRHLEHIQHVVHVVLAKVMRGDRAHQVGVAADVQLLTGQEFVDVGVAARAQQVVAAGAVRIEAVVHGVGGDGGHRPQDHWHIAPAADPATPAKGCHCSPS